MDDRWARLPRWARDEHERVLAEVAAATVQLRAMAPPDRPQPGDVWRRLDEGGAAIVCFQLDDGRVEASTNGASVRLCATGSVAIYPNGQDAVTVEIV